MPLLAGDPIRSSEAPGWVAESLRDTSSGTITTTETVLQSVTFQAVPTARYEVTAIQLVQSTVAGDLICVRLRWSAGASLSASGTLIAAILPNADIAGKGQPVQVTGTVTGLSGQVTVGATAVRDIGSGNVTSFGSSNRQINYVQVKRV